MVKGLGWGRYRRKKVGWVLSELKIIYDSS